MSIYHVHLYFDTLCLYILCISYKYLHFHLYSCWSVSQSLHLFFVSWSVCFTSSHLSVFDFLCLFVSVLFFHTSCMCLCTCWFVSLSVFLADFLSVSCLSMILSLHLTCICLSVYVSVSLPIFLSFESFCVSYIICLSVCVSISVL